VELLTLFEEVPQEYRGISPAVHLPYAIDWYSGWTGKVDPAGLTDEDVRYVMYGRDRGEAVGNIRSAIAHAAGISPAYGVLHAGSADLDEVMLRRQTGDSREVILAFCEMANQVVSGFKGGEPPFKLAFENLWWPGLRLRDPWEHSLISGHIEFDNWGYCLDTGHLMNTLPDAYDEQTCVERLLGIFDRYPDDMKGRIGTVHLHLSTSAGYRNTFEESPRPPGETIMETLSRSYSHAMSIDQHRPFSTAGCKALVDALAPDFVTHEMVGSGTGDVIGDFIQQRSFFPQGDESYK